MRTIREVPRWMMRSALGIFVSTTVPFLILAERKIGIVEFGVFAGYAGVQGLAAVLLGREARRRTGSPRVRLVVAAAATAGLGLGLPASSGGSSTEAAVVVRGVAQALTVASGVAYIVAFLPPRWLRRRWAAGAAYVVHRRLVSAPVSESPAETWQRYAWTVRDVCGADTVVVLLPGEPRAACVAACGRVPDTTLEVDTAELERVLALPQPVRTHADADAGLLAYARAVGARVAVAAPLGLPTADRGLLLLLSRHHALFVEDDARLLGELGAQVAILAERGAAHAEQERLARELGESVQALSTASQAKSDFLANMSHELRTPLNAIIGFSELMRGEPIAEPEQRVVPAEWIEHIFASGQHLLGLISDILDLSKIEAGRMDLRPELLKLGDVVTEVVTTLHPLIDARRLRLTTAVPSVTVRADRTRLRQILYNLLSNAIKFTPEEGDIFVGAAETGTDVQITVADNGPGIAPQDHHRVFEEFRQVGNPELHKAGTGLGMALTRRLIHAHGGTIELDSTLGEGARSPCTCPNWRRRRLPPTRARPTGRVPSWPSTKTRRRSGSSSRACANTGTRSSPRPPARTGCDWRAAASST